MKRRAFLKDTCYLCVGTALSSWFVSSCTAPGQLYKTTAESGVIRIPLSEFAEKSQLVVRVQEIPFDLFVHSKPDKEFDVLLLKCSHRDSPVHVSGNVLVCNEHGSRFSTSGSVLKEPAIEPLKKLKYSLEQDQLIIKINPL